MAILHHAFRCPATAEFDQTVSTLLAAWSRRDYRELSTLALAGYGSLAEREDLRSAFRLHQEGVVSSRMQPQFISPGLAALTTLAGAFLRIPGLSASNDANHHLLETQLPLLGWSSEDINFLLRGNQVEVMLESYAASAETLDQGGYRDTGGWTPGRTVQALKKRLDQLAVGISPHADDQALAAWSLLKESHALADAQAMLAEITDQDWLVMTITA
ncbi:MULTISPECIES: hypothetical protein [unclassified Rhizobium]|uniref:hypothetical protein n=1 Tax=unclassified Rhizobium TaxID=2613769 RepID=UPI001ADCC8B3|nr:MULTISPECIES: hypothetical protein [unclassified Rhizobium]MBO9100170.1 hypothetical protein [Rhizobium sp. L58/93]MBO9135673.1 hypothetical protein [Rhizobium sp. B209b/85]MBO9170136.1 hypothetical protein [Rhizobium sp. L245/93]MBO9186063.1 hypothetical protein [Rhizobium sp. E27B/91]QXZ82995.1 hypothetical protein J5287_13010 [Rhizobium sp. K1/93]